jgi:hypothetical protein
MSEEKKSIIYEGDIESLVEFLKEYQNHINPRRPLEETEFVYCIVGNVVPSHYHGEEKEIIQGTKQFLANAKLFVLPRIGDYKKATAQVIGVSRKTKKYKLVYMPVRLITNWRLKKVYNKQIIEMIYNNDGWRDTEMDRDTILNMIPWLSKLTETNLPID